MQKPKILWKNTFFLILALLIPTTVWAGDLDRLSTVKAAAEFAPTPVADLEKNCDAGAGSANCETKEATEDANAVGNSHQLVTSGEGCESSPAEQISFGLMEGLVEMGGICQCVRDCATLPPAQRNSCIQWCCATDSSCSSVCQ